MGDPSDELYRVDFDDFTARRNHLAKELRAGGDAAAADRVKALKKPTRVAWAINRLSAADAKLRKELLAAGAELRAAQERLLAGDADRTEVRAAQERERAAVDRAAAALAADADARLSAAALEKARGTLHAVAIDDAVRSEFDAQRLAGDHEPGIGGLAAPPAAAARKPAGKAAKKDAADARRAEKLRANEADLRELERAEHEAELDLTSARDVAERAERDLRRASKARDAAAAATAAARERLAELRSARG